MRYKTITTHPNSVTAVDIPTMAEMSIQDYRTYLRTGLLCVDHHDVLRSEPAGYPLAVTQAQVDELIAYLHEIRPTVGRSA
jgi:hypothetical protein